MNTIGAGLASAGMDQTLLRSQAGAAATGAATTGTVGQDDGGGFGQALTDAVKRVDGLQAQADQQVSDLLQGRGGDLHQTLVAVEKADLSFQLMMQVRNKIISAYDEIARMQF